MNVSTTAVNNEPKVMGRPVKDLTGMVFGELKVISPNNDISARHGKHWNCICSCGRTITARSSQLTRGQRVSCGSDRCTAKAGKGTKRVANRIVVKNLTGMRFGKLTALEVDTSQQGQGHAYWICLCDCGQYHTVSSKHLGGGQTQSCGKCGYRSKGENRVSELLTSNGITFKNNTTYKDCRSSLSGYLLRFDFVATADGKDYCIEFDGAQHSQESTGKWNSKYTLEERQTLDADKNRWCSEHGITMIRIPYTRYDDMCIDDLLPSSSQYIVH